MFALDEDQCETHHSNGRHDSRPGMEPLGACLKAAIVGKL